MSHNSSTNSAEVLDFSKYSGFFKKSLEERRTIINSTDEESQRALDGELSFDYADKMIENMVGKLTLPVGVCPYLLLNNEHFVVPMATEEPSVIAAASSATKLVAEMGGGFTAKSTANIVNTQIQFTYKIDHSIEQPVCDAVGHLDHFTQCLIVAHSHAKMVLQHKDAIIAQANELCPRMVQRGGGVVNLRVRVIEPKAYTLHSHAHHLEHGDEKNTTNTLPRTLLDEVCDQTSRDMDKYINMASANQVEANPATHSEEHEPVQVQSSVEQQQRTQQPDSLPSLCVYLSVNVCDAMGANLVNSIAEGLAPFVHEHYTQPIATFPHIIPSIGLRILSNLCVERLTAVEFQIPIEKLAWKQASGEQVAQGILDAFTFSQNDVFRAVTHNKGAMNGITAVALATGQDTRAIEASIHAFCGIASHPLQTDDDQSEQDTHSRTYNVYQPMTRYWIDRASSTLHGKILVPIATGTIGGAIHQHPLFHWSLKTLHNPSAAKLAQIIAAIGLAQNLAAIRALAIEGIQRGHMQLHQRKTG